MQEALLNKYIDSLTQRIDRIRSLRDKLAEGNTKADENIRLLAHSLHGSGASFGFPDISEAARAVEQAQAGGLEQPLDHLQQVLEQVVAANAAGGDRETVAEQPAAKSAAQPAPVQARERPAPVKKAAAPAADGTDILVVDDDPAIIDLVTGALENLPGRTRITAVDNGAKAQEAIVKRHFDLIVMDLVLPDRDGRELIQEIKLEFRIDSPLLVLSAVRNDSVRVECMSLGADKFLTKPFHEDELLKEARKLLGKENKRKLTLVPLDGEAVADADEEEDGGGYLQGRTILVVEDDRMQADLIRQRLINQGAAVKQAANGREAMQLLRTQGFSLVILDVKMPVMDGFEVLERIKGELKLDVPVIMVTAMGSEKDIIRGYDMGVTDYILKPFSDVLLVARVKSLLKPPDR